VGSTTASAVHSTDSAQSRLPDSRTAGRDDGFVAGLPPGRAGNPDGPGGSIPDRPESSPPPGAAEFGPLGIGRAPSLYTSDPPPAPFGLAGCEEPGFALGEEGTAPG